MVRRLGLAFVLACAVTTGPGCDEDSSGTSPTLTLQCSANPASGPAPLTVAFVLNVAGAEGSALSVLINYGDGHQGTNPDDRHVYSSAGAYSASFTVASNTQTARCSAAVTVSGSTVPTPTPTSTPSPSPIPNPPGNQQPQASFKTTPATGSTITGSAPFTVRFNMCQTVDPDRDSLYFKMDLDGDGGFEFQGSTGADCRHEATYAAGTRTATLCVTDVECPFWPVCYGYPLLHPFQCRSYTVTAIP